MEVPTIQISKYKGIFYFKNGFYTSKELPDLSVSYEDFTEKATGKVRGN